MTGQSFVATSKLCGSPRDAFAKGLKLHRLEVQCNPTIGIDNGDTLGAEILRQVLDDSHQRSDMARQDFDAVDLVRSPDEIDEEGYTPLMRACQSEQGL